jgi:exodeoxyribonuclease V gamma subunit
MFSNRLDVLAGRLSDAVGEEQRACGPFAMTPVVVPNPNLARWLQFFIAERRGVAANLEFPYLESGMWQLVCGLAPAGAPRPQLLTHEKLQQLIAAQLVGGSDASASPFVEYCRNAAGEFDVRDAECIRRVWQISGRLATLFREYDYHREGMVRHWLSGADASFFEAEEGRDLSASQREMESAQRALYRAIFLPGEGVLARLPSDAPLWSLRMLCDHYLGDVPDGTRSARVSSLPNSVRLFGLSQLSRFHCELLYRLARLCRVELYHFNVCSEFWEDVTTPREDRWRRVKDTPVGGASGSDEELDLAIENPLLKAWGKAGRETIKLLADLEDQYQECIVDWVDDEGQAGAPGQPGTVLRRIQDAVLLRTSAVGSLPQDRSVQVAGCPGIQREIETVYNSIVTNMDDPETGKAAGLRLTDIAVLVPDMATYKPVIASVFDAHGAVPYSLVDSNAFLDSVFGAAVLGILDLVGSAFTRRKVFEVIFNPCVLAGAGVTHADACQWLAWADELGVFHSFDAAHRVERGLGATSAFTWEQALRRLRLGRILSPPSAGGGIAGPLGDIVPYEDMRSDSVLCEHFNVLLERLFRRLHPLAEATHSCAEWYDIVRGLIEDFLDVPEDMNGEAHVRRVLLNGLADLGGKSDTPGLDAMLSCVGLASGVGFPWVREWLASSLAAIPSGKGAYLTGGVTVASLLPMRPIPFKIVYIVGLGEGGFPGRDERSTLDLRRLRRRVGDVSSTDAGRYLFLETLSSVRAKLVLSYVERDLQKDEELFPCSVLKQLMAFAAEHVLSVSGEESVPLRVYHPPLNGFALTAAQGQSEACSEWTDLYREWSVQDWVLRAQQAVAAGEASAEQVVAAARSARDRLATAPGRGRQIRLLDALLRDLVATDMSAGTAEAAVEVPAAIAADLRDLPLFAGGRTGGSAEAPVPAGGEVVRVTISQLADFIRDPAQACMKRRLGIYAEDDDSEAALAEDEPFAAGFPESYQLVTSAVRRGQRPGGGARRTGQALRRRSAALTPPRTDTRCAGP